MDTLPYRWIFWLAASGYVLAFSFALQALWQQKRYSRSSMIILMAVGWGVQTWGMTLRSQAVGGCPVGNIFELWQFVAWSLVVLYFLVGSTFRMSLLGFFTSALAALMGGVSLLFPAWDAPYQNRYFGAHPVVEAHASLAVFSYGIFAALALVGVMYLVQHWGLKHRRGTGIFSFLPSIVQLDHIGFRLLLIGLAVLSCSLGFGVVLYGDDELTITTSKMVATWGVWAGYLALLILRWRGVVVGSGFARSALLLFLAALFSLWAVDAARQRSTLSNQYPDSWIPENHTPEIS